MRVIVLLTLFACLYVAIQAPYGAYREGRSGIALYYSAGMFAKVAANRHMALRTDVDGYAAVPDCKWIGSIVRARINGGKVEKYQVLDCAQYKDRAALERRGVVIEVDYASAKRNGFVSRGSAPATVYYP